MELAAERLVEFDYGTRARIGVIVPSLNSVVEPDFHTLAPVGVQFFVTRLSLPHDGPDELRAMAGEAGRAAGMLADLEPDLIMFHCTAATMVPDTTRADAIAADIERAADCPASVTANSVVGAFRSLGVRTVAIVAPYMPAVVDGEAAFLSAHGIEVLARRPLGLRAQEFVGISPSEWRKHAVELAAECDPDAVFLSCANVRTLELIDDLERELGKPVVTSNQAAFWGAVRACGVTEAMDGYGRLLRIGGRVGMAGAR